MSDRATLGLLGRLHDHDVRVLGYLVGRRHQRLDGAMRAVTHLGDPPVVVAVALLFLFAPAGTAHTGGVRAAIALAVSHLLVQLLKRTISRPRPRLPVGVASLIQAPDRFSFPSGHAAAALAVAAGLATVATLPVGLLLVCVALVVGVSRCYLGVHYPGDVVAGWMLALTGVLVSLL